MSDDETTSTPKIHDGYHGWMKSIPKTDQDFTPVRLEGSAPVASGSSTASVSGNSVWNAAGTWEERDKSEWARTHMKAKILEGFQFQNEKLQVSISACSFVRCDGSAKLVFSRGRKRCGFDISVKFEWKSTRLVEDAEGIESVTGHVELHEFEDTNADDYEVRVTLADQGQHAEDAKRAIREWEPELRKLLAAWRDDLLQQ